MNAAIIVAAGRGTRMGGAPTQFRLLAGKPLIVHTLRRFEEARSVDRVVLVVPPASLEEAGALVLPLGFTKTPTIVAGGATRMCSVRHGLSSLENESVRFVHVHDGARPFVMPAEIDRVTAAAAETGAAILASHATDTIKEVRDGFIARTPPRDALRHALTPQCFDYALIRDAYRAAERDRFTDATDDSSLVERLGTPVRVCDGGTRNIKITRPEDWLLAERMMEEVMGDG